MSRTAPNSSRPAGPAPHPPGPAAGESGRAARQLPVSEIGPLYHGTTEERARRILEHGFTEKDGRIYLTPHPELAPQYAEGRVQSDGGGIPAVLRIDRVRGVSGHEVGYMDPDKARAAGADYQDKGPEVVVLNPAAIHGISRHQAAGIRKAALAGKDLARHLKEMHGWYVYPGHDLAHEHAWDHHRGGVEVPHSHAPGEAEHRHWRTGHPLRVIREVSDEDYDEPWDEQAPAGFDFPQAVPAASPQRAVPPAPQARGQPRPARPASSSPVPGTRPRPR